MAKNVKSLGPMTAAATVLESRRLVCITTRSHKEYIGYVAVDDSGPSSVYYGYCEWARVGGARQSAVYYRGADRNAAFDAVLTKLMTKMNGRSGSRYEVEDNRPLLPFMVHTTTAAPSSSPTGASSGQPQAGALDSEDTHVQNSAARQTNETLADSLLRRRGLPKNATIGDILRRR